MSERRLRAVLLDWAGTTVDYGSRAPVAVLREVFALQGVTLDDASIRRHMGLRKFDHLTALCSLPEVQSAWYAAHQRGLDPADVDALYARFEALQPSILLHHSHVLPWTPAAVAQLRSMGLRIGSTTGYTRPMLAPLIEQASRQGYSPDASVTPDEAPAGRPFPWMAYLNALRLQVYPLDAWAKIGDTPSDMEEGRNAGMWCVGLLVGGNGMGMTEAEWNALALLDQVRRKEAVAAQLLAAGAHMVAETLADAPAALTLIDDRYRAGEKP
ncbi:MAG: phosphonoacetaldehyde hydrolase [Acidobacteria bacterium]|nr:phosphonoacetaldehyde hydrolase [Acidobacteriota bacterium]